MKNYILLLFLISIVTMVSCVEKRNYGQANIDLQTIEKDFMKWWIYHNNYIKLSSNFIAIDNSSKKITKEEFLEKLTSGKFIPLKLESNDSLIYYKLFKLDETAKKDIRSTIKQTSYTKLNQYRMEGIHFPAFNFVDLNGNIYTNKNTKGKIVVLKCWFIHCKPCVAEFPKLNNLVEQYKDRTDIVFISLALDQKKELQQFLLEKPFKYAVVPNQEHYITNTLQIRAYPTHYIINRDGVIEKIVNDADEMISILKRKNMIEKREEKKKIPPSPPPPPPTLSTKNPTF